MESFFDLIYGEDVPLRWYLRLARMVLILPVTVLIFVFISIFCFLYVFTTPFAYIIKGKFDWLEMFN